MRKDSLYGNSFLYFYADVLEEGISMNIAWEVALSGRQPGNTLPSPLKNAELFVRSQEALPIHPHIKTLSASLVKDKKNTLAKGGAIFRHVVAEVRPSDTQNNTGDLTVLFVTLARAAKIPANFISGLPLGADTENVIAGSSTWAEIYEGQGWVPVDTDAAAHDPQRSDFYFGNLDSGRVEFASGRDLTLNPPQKSGPISLFWLPHIEVDGQKINDFKASWRYRRI
jgi:hypothetical protein